MLFRSQKLYRYYVSMDALRSRIPADPTLPHRLPANMVEEAVVAEVRRMVMTPEMVSRVIFACRNEDPDIEEREVIAALGRFNNLWTALIPIEQARIIKMLVERVIIRASGITVILRKTGLADLVHNLNQQPEEQRAA